MINESPIRCTPQSNSIANIHIESELFVKFSSTVHTHHIQLKIFTIDRSYSHPIGNIRKIHFQCTHTSHSTVNIHNRSQISTSNRTYSQNPVPLYTNITFKWKYSQSIANIHIQSELFVKSTSAGDKPHIQLNIFTINRKYSHPIGIIRKIHFHCRQTSHSTEYIHNQSRIFTSNRNYS